MIQKMKKCIPKITNILSESTALRGHIKQIRHKEQQVEPETGKNYFYLLHHYALSFIEIESVPHKIIKEIKRAIMFKEIFFRNRENGEKAMQEFLIIFSELKTWKTHI